MPTSQNKVHAQLQFPLDHLANLYLLHYSVVNPSVPIVRLKLLGNRGLVTKQSIDNMGGGSVVYLFGGPPGAVTHTDLGYPVALLDGIKGTSGIMDVSLNLEATAPDGTSLTHGGITLWLGLAMAPVCERVRHLKDTDSRMAFNVNTSYNT
jgi:hypothetical protein